MSNRAGTPSVIRGAEAVQVDDDRQSALRLVRMEAVEEVGPAKVAYLNMLDRAWLRAGWVTQEEGYQGEGG